MAEIRARVADAAVITVAAPVSQRYIEGGWCCPNPSTIALDDEGQDDEEPNERRDGGPERGAVSRPAWSLRGSPSLH